MVSDGCAEAILIAGRWGSLWREEGSQVADER